MPKGKSLELDKALRESGYEVGDGSPSIIRKDDEYAGTMDRVMVEADIRTPQGKDLAKFLAEKSF